MVHKVIDDEIGVELVDGAVVVDMVIDSYMVIGEQEELGVQGVVVEHDN